jgi:hypothetical protein
VLNDHRRHVQPFSAAPEVALGTDCSTELLDALAPPLVPGSELLRALRDDLRALPSGCEACVLAGVRAVHEGGRASNLPM